MSSKYSIKKRVFAAVITAAVLVPAVLSGCGNNTTDGASQTESKPVSTASTPAPSADAIAAQSANFAVPKPIVSFLFNNAYSQRREYAAFQGLDVTKSLKEQYYSEADGITWFDVFMDETKRYLQQVLVLCEAAKENGVELEDSDLDTVETTIQNIRSAAESVGMDFNEYILAIFGEGISEDMIRDYTKLTALMSKYYRQVYDGYTYTDEDYEKFFEENKTSYQYANYLQYNFSFAAAGDTSATEEEQKAAKEKAKAYADRLAQCTSATEFKNFLKDYLSKNTSVIAAVAAADHELTQEELNSAIDQEIENAYFRKYAYEVTSNAGKWIFDLSHKNRDTTVIENKNSYTVLMVTKTAYRDETVSKNVRHILFTPESYRSDSAATDDAASAAALQKATEVYESWQSGDKTEESFAALAQQFSDDTGSKESGGLYEDVTEGQMVTEFNDWLFDYNRKPGDSGIVKTTYGYHIMYFVGDGTPAWKLSVDTVMRKTDFEDTYAALAQKYPVEFVEDVLSSIHEIEVQESSGITYDESSVTESTEDAGTSPAESTADAGTSPAESTADASTSPAESTADASTSPAESTADASTSPAESAASATA